MKRSYAYETHAHTTEVSSCGRVRAADALRMYKSVGYQGIIFTDHFHDDYVSSLGNMSWEAKIDCYLTGYREAAKVAGELDMDVLWGMELRFTENDNDYLVYGIDSDFLKGWVDLHRSSISVFMESIKSRADILVYQAHPFRDGCRLVDPVIVHGLEIYNGNPRHDSRNNLAAQAAAENSTLILSGSDFHRPGDLASGGVFLPERISCNAELITALKAISYDALIAKEPVCK
ncbi:PHP domain-containing protein [Sediminispirochaeta smaragdinae]|uniref:PHP domain protein n=1 Tax=Sediminispirochaeta smaragdinae (strain DSM 11293 / JCM 15392 / SEBR 4228) TaxID=573413 RepID=E1R6F9_SEDSS|nr:PHP-associated domain-containing protein [Sediminispirochaeta smaragdinae]ADK80977.1 PHP domain protein [Sediminispirochaeta smaragdinae DSM 11293]